MITAVPLTDVQAAYYGYSVIETRGWVNGVVERLRVVKRYRNPLREAGITPRKCPRGALFMEMFSNHLASQML